jgi:hypothetical protein
VSEREFATRFSQLFDRAAGACARAQALAAQCADTAARARSSHASARRLQALAVETRAAWAGANATYGVMRREVELVASAMLASGVSGEAAAAAVRARVRFVLYDGGLREQDAEPVVETASDWVDAVYAA